MIPATNLPVSDYKDYKLYKKAEKEKRLKNNKAKDTRKND